MSRKKPSDKVEYAVFDVFYEDGAQTSHRRMPRPEISALDAEASIRQFFEAEDRAIADRSGRARAAIKTIAPSGKR